MTENEFHLEISKLCAAFVGRVPQAFDDSKRAWFNELRWASKLAFSRAISDLIRNDRFPVLSQLISSTNEHTPRLADGYLMNFSFCYKNIESESLRCGCPQCHPEYWCKEPNCQLPVESRTKHYSKQPSRELCYLHSDDIPIENNP